MSDQQAFASFIITYQRPAILERTIEQLLGQSLPPDYILVIDNGAAESDGLAGDAAEVTKGFSTEQVGYHPMPYNSGPAGGAAAGMEQLFNKGYDWVHWVDDDNPPKTHDTLERLMALVALAGDDASAARAFPNQQLVGAVSAAGSWWDWRKGKHKRPPDEALKGTVEVDVASGGNHPIISRQAVEQVGLPNAHLFFSFEDPEFFLRVRRAGMKILVPGDLHREYRVQSGRMNLDRKRRFVPQAGRDEIWRRYYSRRNYIYMMLNTFGRPDLAFREALIAGVKMAASWRRGWKYGLLYNRLIGRALLDGVRGKLGRTIPPEAKHDEKEHG